MDELTTGPIGAAPLVVDQLFKSYAGHTVLDGMDLHVESGTVQGLVGLNGAGKTTAMSCILGLQPFQRGAVSVLGKRPGQLYQTQGKVAAVFDEPCLQPHFRVDEVLRYAQLSVAGKDHNYRETVLQWLGLERYRSYKVRNLSLGNRRRTAIAQALVSRPAFMVLDEPFNGLDAGGVDDVLNLIRTLNRQGGITFLLASHQLPYLESICTHMSILHKGRIEKSGPIGALLAHERPRVAITTPQVSEVKACIRQMAGVKLLDTSEDAESLYCELMGIDSARLNQVLVENGFHISELRLHKPSLDSLFRTITGTRP